MFLLLKVYNLPSNSHIYRSCITSILMDIMSNIRFHHPVHLDRLCIIQLVFLCNLKGEFTKVSQFKSLLKSQIELGPNLSNQDCKYYGQD